jgi:hypothetical protein
MAAGLDEFKRTLVYRRKAPIEVLLDDLVTIRTLDRTSEVRQKAWTAVGCLSLVATIGTGVLIASNPMYPPALYLVPAALLISMFAGFVLGAKHKRTNVENRRYHLLARVLELLKRDCPHAAEVVVALDLRRPDIKEKYVRKGKSGTWDVRFYTDRWLTLRGRLLDGTAFRLALIDKHQARSRWARGRSGKMKHKTKTKSATEAALLLKAKARRYPRLNELSGQARSAVKLPEWATLKAFAIKGDPNAHRLALSAATKTNWDVAEPGKSEKPSSGVRLVAMMFLSLYQVLNLARTAEKA